MGKSAKIVPACFPKGIFTSQISFNISGLIPCIFCVFVVFDDNY